MQYNYFATCILHRELYNHRILGPIHIRSYIIWTPSENGVVLAISFSRHTQKVRLLCTHHTYILATYFYVHMVWFRSVHITSTCGLSLFCFHYGKPCSFNTFFSISVATHETVCDVRTCDLFNEFTIIATIMQHLSH